MEQDWYSANVFETTYYSRIWVNPLPMHIVCVFPFCKHPNWNTGGSRLIFSAPFSYFLFIFYLPRIYLLPDFPSVSSLASLPFLPCCHRTTTTRFTWGCRISLLLVQRYSRMNTQKQKGNTLTEFFSSKSY